MDFSYPIILESTLYFWGSLLLIPLWLFGYIRRKDSKKELLVCSTLFGIGGILIGYFYATKDYWSPPYIFGNKFPLEDFLYGFLFGGISSEIFEIVLGYVDIKRGQKKRIHTIPIFVLVVSMSFLLLVNIFKFNSIIAHILSPIFVGLISILLNRTFLIPSLLSGLFMLLITFLWQSTILIIYPNAVIDIWMIDNLINMYINGIPIEELIFAFSLGFGASTFYELIMGYEYVKKR